jgi:putative transposase
MEELQRERIALFRFSLIAEFVNRKDMAWGERQRLLKRITDKEWEIPGSGKTRIGRATVLRWLGRYQHSGGDLESLKPQDRADRGRSRALEPETELALVNLRKQLPEVSVPVLLKVARERRILGPEFSVSVQSIYRMLNRHGLKRSGVLPTDRRRFEAELSNDLWQSDCLHGPRVLVEGKLRKSYLFAVIDDHSRLIPWAQFYLSETLESFQDCLIHALASRGLPRKLYVDNGAVFRTHQLSYGCARLGIALLHSQPYESEGRGKIERLMKTIRGQLLSCLPPELTLEKLNELLRRWMDTEYHHRPHSATGQSPLERYLEHVALLRPAPKNLQDYYRHTLRRKVDKDRTVSLHGKLYEAPVGLVGQTVTLLYHRADPTRIEVFFQERSWGFLVPLDPHINSRVRRLSRERNELFPPAQPSPEQDRYRGGELFGAQTEDTP